MLENNRLSLFPYFYILINNCFKSIQDFLFCTYCTHFRSCSLLLVSPFAHTRVVRWYTDKAENLRQLPFPSGVRTLARSYINLNRTWTDSRVGLVGFWYEPQQTIKLEVATGAGIKLPTAEVTRHATPQKFFSQIGIFFKERALSEIKNVGIAYKNATHFTRGKVIHSNRGCTNPQKWENYLGEVWRIRRGFVRLPALKCWNSISFGLLSFTFLPR